MLTEPPNEISPPKKHSLWNPAYATNIECAPYLIRTLRAPCENVRTSISIETLRQTPHQTLLYKVTGLEIHGGEGTVEHTRLRIGELGLLDVHFGAINLGFWVGGHFDVKREDARRRFKRLSSGKNNATPLVVPCFFFGWFTTQPSFGARPKWTSEYVLI
jgi:hypothetical protein